MKQKNKDETITKMSKKSKSPKVSELITIILHKLFYIQEIIRNTTKYEIKVDIKVCQ